MSIARNLASDMAAKIADTVGARGQTYGAPEDNFATIAALWSAYTSRAHGRPTSFSAHDVGVMSALIKVARLAESPTHQDSALDGATYLMLACGVAVDAIVRDQGDG